MKVKIKGDYAKRRRAEYPSIEDQIDALWKGGQAEADMRERVLAVKRKYPKNVQK